MRICIDAQSNSELGIAYPPSQKDAARPFGAKFVDEVIQALIELDAEHLEALCAAAERFSQDAVLQMSASEAATMTSKMQIFSGLLAETRRNLRIFGLSIGNPDSYGYNPGRK